MTPSLSIIIPVGPKEYAWQSLLQDLALLPIHCEIILSATQEAPPEFEVIRNQFKNFQNIRWIKSTQGRARQLNNGAKEATNPYLWFLHADTRLKANSFKSLTKAIEQAPHALHYFNLQFLDDGPALTKINAACVWIRSHLVKLPFGDQGFCLSLDVFNKLGGFSKETPMGEDHLLVWAAHQQGVKVRCTGSSVYTSARKYQEYGWIRTTTLTFALTIKQALPKFLKFLIRDKC